MERIYNILDELKAEVQKLKEEDQTKSMLYDGLRKSHMEQVAKVQQSESEMEMLTNKLNSKSEEICEIRKSCEELRYSLQKKDSFLQQVISANEKLRVEYSEKIVKLEGGNRGLLVALAAASVRIEDLERKALACSDEIAGLKSLLSVKQEKDLEAEMNASKNLKDRDECVIKLEELKWKNEQFLHLDEAHGKLQAEFEGYKVELHKERFTLIDEISSLQATVDDQIRMAESMETELRMSNQALPHEKRRREVLKIEMSESKSQFENVRGECQGAKSEIEQLTIKRGEELAELRALLRKKELELLSNETKYRIAQSEQENSYLMQSLKDAQEAQLNTLATSSLTKLQNRMQSSEQLHAKCSVNIKVEEAEWNYHMDKQKESMTTKCLSKFEGKNKRVTKLHEELVDCKWLLDVKDEEISAMLMVLKSEFERRSSEDLMELRKLQRAEKEKDSDNLIELLKDRDGNISKLQNHINILESEAEEMHRQEKDNCNVETLLKEIDQLKNELAEREVVARKTVEQQNELLLQKDFKIEQLQRQMESLDQNLRSAMISLAEKEKDEALMRIKSQKMLKTEEINRNVTNLVKGLNALRNEDDELTIKLGKLMQLFESADELAGDEQDHHLTFSGRSNVI